MSNIVLADLFRVFQVCHGSVTVQRVDAIRRFVVVAIGAAVLSGAGNFGAKALALAAQPAATQAPAAQAPATPAPQAPTAAAPSTPAAQTLAAPPAPASVAVAPVVAAEPQGGTIQGTVKASGVPLPGVAVTATNTLTGKKYATTTDINGAFQMAVPRNGRYVVKTDLTGFASVTQEVVVNASSQNGGLPTRDRGVQGGPRLAGHAGANADGHRGRRQDRNSHRSRTGHACRWRHGRQGGTRHASVGSPEQ